MRKFFRLFINKFTANVLLLLLQLVLIPVAVMVPLVYFSFYSRYIFAAIVIIIFILNASTAILILNNDMHSEYKVSWLVFVFLFSPIGVFIYLIWSMQHGPRKKIRKKYERMPTSSTLTLSTAKLNEEIQQVDTFSQLCANYVAKNCSLSYLDCYNFKYFNNGEKYLEELLIQLKRAKKFIFLEYYIIATGKAWNAILEILKEKVQEGVEVRILYDDLGSYFHLPSNYHKQIAKFGIKVIQYNRFKPIINIALNNRTHRKITVIDGNTAFTGGINLADEYFNIINRFGHWKDTGVMIQGRAVQNFTSMFLRLWQLSSEEHGSQQYLTNLAECPKGNIVAIPFYDTPYNHHYACTENIYLRLIYQAKKYIYINTPYLLLDNEMQRALTTAAKSGIDVRITIPQKPDKKYVYAQTKANYKQLLPSGVKIYLYSPGFLHAKSIVVDDSYAVIGSSNMDFRSFYLQHECNILFSNVDVAIALKDDFLATCQVSQCVSYSMIKYSFFRNIYRAFLRLLTPLL